MMAGELIKTGTEGLDEIFFGGIIPDNSLLVEGSPGAGKTTLGLQYIYRGAADFGQPGIIITFEEEPEKLYRDALVFGWDLRHLESRNLLRIIPSSPEAVRDMLLKPESGFSRISRSIGANRVMVDSITHFRRLTDNTQQLRVLLSKFITGLMKLTSSAVLIKEIESTEREGANIEEYIIDTVVRLSYEQHGRQRRERFLEVVKSRGQKHLSGKHTLRFNDTGLVVYPVCGALHGLDGEGRKKTGKKQARAHVSTGIEGLDLMCQGGLPAGSSSVVAGSSGTGKSVLAAQFMYDGLKGGEPVLLVRFGADESEALETTGLFSARLEKHVGDGKLKVLFRSTHELAPDELLHELKSMLDQHKPGRLVVDSLSQLMQSVDDEEYTVDYLGALLKLFAHHGVTSLFTFEMDKMFGSLEIDSRRTLGLFDNLVLLRYVELEGEIHRAVAILKMRGTDHHKSIQEYVIGDKGIEVKHKFEKAVDVMGGGAASSGPDRLELKDILEDATRWAQATRRMRERQGGGF
ncbi:MAG: AAA family ATPase [Candidatus Glassbacteria bacterium]|nr:AAA family ATPase [Candidatus Glassbacteria bacterium]